MPYVCLCIEWKLSPQRLAERVVSASQHERTLSGFFYALGSSLGSANKKEVSCQYLWRQIEFHMKKRLPHGTYCKSGGLRNVFHLSAPEINLPFQFCVGNVPIKPFSTALHALHVFAVFNKNLCIKFQGT